MEIQKIEVYVDATGANESLCLRYRTEIDGRNELLLERPICEEIFSALARHLFIFAA